jgi:hypothetical protein
MRPLAFNQEVLGSSPSALTNDFKGLHLDRLELNPLEVPKRFHELTESRRGRLDPAQWGIQRMQSQRREGSTREHSVRVILASPYGQ